ncbi:MAG: hypothetical protein L6R36_006363 [Xanthoria steineri]|nr:MAG: hypothetical protein L6R36_006363 [Xanthoria steineri]
MADYITSSLPICTGYLDRTLEIFSLHQHPFIVVSTLAVRWGGVGSLPQEEIDVLVRSADLAVIVEHLLASGGWELADNYVTKDLIPDRTMINSTTIQDIWLKTRIEDPWFRYLRLWPENLYNLSVDCPKIEIPDLLAKHTLLLEEEYYRDPHGRFGPARASLYPNRIMPRLQIQARLTRPDIPIFIPTIEAHLNALLAQSRLEKETKLPNGNLPSGHNGLFISQGLDPRYRNLHLQPGTLRNKIDKYRRGRGMLLWDVELDEWVAGKLPWELGIKKVPSSVERNQPCDAGIDAVLEMRYRQALTFLSTIGSSTPPQFVVAPTVHRVVRAWSALMSPCSFRAFAILEF